VVELALQIQALRDARGHPQSETQPNGCHRPTGRSTNSCSISSMNLCRRFKAAGIMTLSPTVRDLIDAALFVVDPYCHGSRGQPTQVTIASSHRFTAARCPLWLPTNKCLAKSSCTGGAPPLVTCKTTVGKLKKMRVAYDSIIKV
jgi:hypothetical protein